MKTLRDRKTLPVLPACLLLFLTVTSVHAQTPASLKAELLDEIHLEKEQLNATEEKIRTERTNLVATLRQLEESVASLRTEAANARRLEDEKTLSLNSLQTRLDQWREQDIYQQYLLNSFHTLVTSEENDNFLLMEGREKLLWLEQYVQTMEAGIPPVWNTENIVMPNGEMTSAKTLSSGPLKWFVNTAAEQAGLLVSDNAAGQPLVTDTLFKGEQLSSMLSLQASGEGRVSFDPTMGQALALEASQQTLFAHIRQGGVWVIPIMFFALLATAVALVKALQFARLPKLHTDGLSGLLDSASRLEAGTEADMLAITKNTATGQSRDDQLFTLLMKTRQRLEKGVSLIAVIASVSPLLGLLGTVSGMIETFQLMTLFGAGDPEAVSSGISKALITTELGLVVAIPALLVHAVLSRKLKSHMNTLENNALELSQYDQDAGATV